MNRLLIYPKWRFANVCVFFAFRFIFKFAD